MEVSIWSMPPAIVGGWLASNKASVQCETHKPASGLSFVACGCGTATLVTSAHHLYLMQLRVPPERPGDPRLVEPLKGLRISRVSCGGAYLIAITIDGVAYLLRYEEVNAAVQGNVFRFDMPHRVLKASCGDTHALLSTEDGKLFSFGDGSRGQLGLRDVTSVNVPTLVGSLAHLQVIEVAAGRQHSVAVTNFGNVFCWGDNAGGQLGDGTTLSSSSPTLLSAMRSVRSVVASEMTAAMCSDGAVYAWGNPASATPSRVNCPYAYAIALCSKAVCVLCEGARLLVCGVGHNNQPGGLSLDGAGVVSLAAAQHHIVALRRRPLPRLGDVDGPRSKAAETYAAWSRTAGSNVASADLISECTRLATQVDEVVVVNFFEETALLAEAEAAEGRCLKVGLALAAERSDAERLQLLVLAVARRLELNFCKKQINEHNSGMPTQTTLGGLGSPSSLAIELQGRLAEVRSESQILHAEEMAFNQELAETREDLAENASRLRRLDDACAQAHALADQFRNEVRTSIDVVAAHGAEFNQVQDAMHSVSLSCTHREEAEESHFRREVVSLEKSLSTLELAKCEHARQAVHVDLHIASREKSREELETRVQSLNAECLRLRHDSTHEETATRALETRIASLRGEHASLENRLTDWARQDAFDSFGPKLMDGGQSTVLRARMQGVHTALRASQEEVIACLDARLSRISSGESAVDLMLHQQASQFSEAMAPLYAELQKLHQLA